MAAATIASEGTLEVMGHSLVKHYKLAAPADTNTLDVAGMSSIKSVQITPAVVAPAAWSIAAEVSGNTITFQVESTAIDVWMTVFGTN